MHVLEAIESRRSVKAFDPTHEMPEADFQKLIQAGRLAPTAFNIQHPRFVVIKDPELRKQIRAAAWDQAQVTDASVLIVMCADKNAWQKDPARYWQLAPQPVQDFMVPAIDGYYRDHEQTQRDETMRSCGLAAQNLMLAARGLGYDSCPMDGFDFDAVAKLINLPEDHVISMFVAVGKKIKEPNPRSGAISQQEQIIIDRF
ncbi:nitroreductase family protein [Kiritimatiellaeota bacterium B1221]|nr:nitroreductase family protein [Kiritimatiellaeota bacterium B1221]